MPKQILLLRGLDTLTTEEDILASLGTLSGRPGDEVRAGAIKRILLVRDRATRSSWGYAFVHCVDVRVRPRLSIDECGSLIISSARDGDSRQRPRRSYSSRWLPHPVLHHRLLLLPRKLVCSDLRPVGILFQRRWRSRALVLGSQSFRLRLHSASEPNKPQARYSSRRYSDSERNENRPAQFRRRHGSVLLFPRR